MSLSLVDVRSPTHLEELTLSYCLKFESLPGSMHMLLPSLRSLCIQGCSILESFPDKGFPSSLKVLKIINCSRLVGSLKGALTDNSSLETLWIIEPDVECFPDEGLLPLSLPSLIISNCPNLEKLDCKGLHQLSSLQNLYLISCLNLQSLPEEGLPKSISKLRIRDCPLLISNTLPPSHRDCQLVRGTIYYGWSDNGPIADGLISPTNTR